MLVVLGIRVEKGTGRGDLQLMVFRLRVFVSKHVVVSVAN